MPIHYSHDRRNDVLLCITESLRLQSPSIKPSDATYVWFPVVSESSLTPHPTQYTGWPKKVSHHQFFKKILLRLPTRLDFFVKLKHESSTIIQPIGNKYFVRDLLL